MRWKTLSLIAVLCLPVAASADPPADFPLVELEGPRVWAEPIEVRSGPPIRLIQDEPIQYDAFDPDAGDSAYVFSTPDNLFGPGTCANPAVPCQDWGYATRFTTDGTGGAGDPDAGPVTLKTITMAVYSEPGPNKVPMNIFVWPDDGGHKPDLMNPIIGWTYTPQVGDDGGFFVTLDVSADNVQIDSHTEFHVGATWLPFATGSGTPGTALFMDDGQFGVETRWSLLEDFWQSSAQTAACIPWPTWSILGDVGLGIQTPVIRLEWDRDELLIPPANRRFYEASAETQVPSVSRAAWGDFDNDGDHDLYTGNDLYENMTMQGNPVLQATGGAIPGGFTGGLWGDLDNDGDLDLVAWGRTDTVYENQAGAFGEVPNHGIDDGGWNTQAAALGDINNDGILDVYLANFEDCAQCPLPPEYYTYYDDSCDSTPTPPDAGVPDNPCIWKWAGMDQIFLGNGDRTFTNILDLDPNAQNWFVAPQEHPTLIQDVDGDTFTDIILDVDPGIANAVTYNWSRGVNMADADNDGDLDIYVPAYLLQPNHYWENQGGWYAGAGFLQENAQAYGLEGRYTDQACVDLGVEDTWGHGAGAAWGDVNHDEYLDLVVPHLAHSNWRGWSDRTRVWLGGASGFTDHTAASGIPYMETDMVAHFADYDNDCDEDLYIASVYNEWYGRAFANDGTGAFTIDTFPTDLYADNVFQGGGWIDFENDGDMDLTARDGFFRNRTDTQDPAALWLKVLPVGWVSNRAAIGTKIIVSSPALPPGAVMVREVDGGSGSGAQEGFLQHFGMGCIGLGQTVDVEVRFPSGQVQTVAGVAPQGPGDPPLVVQEVGARIVGPAEVCFGQSADYNADVRGGPFTMMWDLDGDTTPETPDPGGPVGYTPAAAGENRLLLEARDAGNLISTAWKRVLAIEENPPTFDDTNVRGIDIESCTGQGLQIEWDPAAFNTTTGEGTYTLERADYVGGNCDWAGAIVLDSGPALLAYTDASTVVGSTYCYRVTAETLNYQCLDPASAVSTGEIAGITDTDNSDVTPAPDIRPVGPGDCMTAEAFCWNNATARWDWSNHQPGEGVIYTLRSYRIDPRSNVFDPQAIWSNIPLGTQTEFPDAFPTFEHEIVFTEVIVTDDCGNETPSCRDVNANGDCAEERQPL